MIMEPKPIKRSESIMKLSREHHFSLLFCWQIREGIKKKTAPWRMVRYVRYFWNAHLQPHFKEEEAILFAPLSRDEMVRKAIGEHEALRQNVRALDTLQEENTADALAGFADRLDRHVRYEERELFPYLERTLTEPQLETIGRQLNTLPADPLKDDYEDEFWRERSASL
ncbi:MAG TPA: hemerythrin domain-containing protein [Agriterribacter sp.]|nr:hemerythrin domain-containing protein [Agriterribacter sp.]